MFCIISECVSFFSFEKERICAAAALPSLPQL